MAISDLPQEILTDIFSRLPAKSVGRCRCLAKTWRSLLSTPQFIKSHLIRKPYQRNLILLDRSGSVRSAAAAEGAVSRKLQLQHNIVEIAGSCDGLVLLVDFHHRKFLVNPITLQMLEITDSPLALPNGESRSLYGFGYDRISDDYKIVALSVWETYDLDCGDAFVDVYSVRNRCWKRVDNSPYDHSVPHLSCGAFVNGAIHCLASSREERFQSVIAAFDLAQEVFDEIPPPSDVDLAKFVFYKLVVFEGCLCMVDAGISRCDVWVMKEYGVGESWTKFRIEGECEFDMIVWPLCFVGDDEEVLLLNDCDSLVVHNVKEKSFRDMGFHGVPGLFVRGGGVFVESLVSPALLEEGRKATYFEYMLSRLVSLELHESL